MKFTGLLVVAALVLATGTAGAATPTFSIVAIPDTQNEQGSLGTMAQWILDNQATHNIVFATHEGDMTSTGGSGVASAASAMYRLDGHMAWGAVPGNHDYYNSGATYFNSSLAPTHFNGQSWFGGSCQQSSFLYFQGGGRTFLGLQIQFDAPTEVLDWAQGVINSNYSLPVILTTHDYLSDAGARTAYGETLWNTLVKPNNQIFMVLAGHMHAADGEYNQTSLNTLNQPVFEMIADYQGRPNGGNGFQRLITFDEDNSKISVKTISATGGGYETDADSWFNLTMDYDTRLIPEPATMSLLALGGLALLRRRRR